MCLIANCLCDSQTDMALPGGQLRGDMTLGWRDYLGDLERWFHSTLQTPFSYLKCSLLNCFTFSRLFNKHLPGTHLDRVFCGVQYKNKALPIFLELTLAMSPLVPIISSFLTPLAHVPFLGTLSHHTWFLLSLSLWRFWAHTCQP